MKLHIHLKKNRIHFLYIFILTLFCLFRFQESFFKFHYSEFFSPDGYGSIGGYQMFIDQIHKSKTYLFSDVFRTELLGEGVLEPGPFSTFWKFYFYLLSFFFDSFEINTYSVFFIGLLNGIFFYFLVNHFTKSKLLSFAGAILIISLYNFHIRSNGHLTGLGSIFMPILLFGSALYTSENKNTSSFFYLAIANLLNFNCNEYYGFYGLWITGFICLYMILKNYIETKRFPFEILKKSFFLLLVVVVCLFIVYPTIIREKVIAKFFHEDTGFLKGIAHAPENIYFYSIQSLKELILPNRYLFADDQIYKNPERTYSIGLSVILFTLANLFLLRKKLSKNQKNLIYVSLVTILISIIICLDPRIFPSLASINAKIAPMFRVTYRSLIYFDISFVFLFLYSCYLLMSSDLKTSFNQFKHKYVFGIILVVGLELPYPHLLKPIANQAYPDSRGLSWLKNEPDTIKIVEIPYYPYGNGVNPERSYRYVYNYFFHRKEILNFPFTEANNDKFKAEIDKFSAFVNSVSEDAIRTLYKMGAKYVIYNYEGHIKINIEKLKENKLLSIVSDDKTQHAIFKINIDDDSFNTKNIIFDYLIPKDKMFDFSTSCNSDEQKYFRCGDGAKVRFYNYYDKTVSVDANIEIRNYSTNSVDHKKINFTLDAKKEQVYILKKFFNINELDKLGFKFKDVKISQ